MYKFWTIKGSKNEDVFLTPAAQCATEDDVRKWMEKNHPNINIVRIVEGGNDC